MNTIIPIAAAGWNQRKRVFTFGIVVLVLLNYFWSNESNGLANLVILFFFIFISFWVYRRAEIEISKDEIKVVWILFVIRSQKVNKMEDLQEVVLERKNSSGEYIVSFVFKDKSTFTLPQNHDYEKVSAYYLEIKSTVERIKSDVKFSL